MRFVDQEDGAASAFFGFGGQGVLGLGGQDGGVLGGLAAGRCHHGGVQASHSQGGVGQVDDVVAGAVDAADGGAGGAGFPRAGFAGDDADGAFADAPDDAGGGFVVAVVAVQHLQGEVLGERFPVELVVGVHFEHGLGLPGSGGAG